MNQINWIALGKAALSTLAMFACIIGIACWISFGRGRLLYCCVAIVFLVFTWTFYNDFYDYDRKFK
jgi:1,4-dihydroxy-2-naphthoate octaprenyltransferase